MEDWIKHLGDMRRSEQGKIHNPQQKWLKTWRAAPKNIDAYDEAADKFSTPIIGAHRSSHSIWLQMSPSCLLWDPRAARPYGGAAPFRVTWRHLTRMLPVSIVSKAGSRVDP